MAELVDLVNSRGEIIEAGVERAVAEARKDAYMRIVILVITNRKGEVLFHQRHKDKSIEPNKIDHVCGAVKSDETPEQACMREAQEELGVVPTGLRRVSEGVNVYGYYRILFAAQCEQPPVVDIMAKEANFASVTSIDDLRDMQESGEYQFVDDFFTDYEAVLT